MQSPPLEITDLLKHLAREAGHIMMKRLESRYNIYKKSDGTRVTDVDLEISEMIQKLVSREFPEAVLFSEELDEKEFCPGRPHLIIDELDGTSAFIEKRLGFSHQSAYYDPDCGLTFGLSYHPWNEKLLWAAREGGAWLEEQRDKIRLPQPKHPSREKFRYAHPYRYRGDKYRRLLSHMGVGEKHLVMTDSTRTYLLATGELDAAVMLMSRIPEWDWAAEKVIVQELGYYHGYLNGEPARFGEEPPEDNPGYLICPREQKEVLMEAVGGIIGKR